MVITLCVQPSDFQLKEIQAEASIQAVANEELVLVSNNLYSLLVDLKLLVVLS